MQNWQRIYVTGCAFVMAFALTYVAVDYLGVPRLIHYQHEHLWRLEVRATSMVPAGYVGLWLWALISAAIVATACYGAVYWRKSSISGRLLDLLLAWAITAVVIACAYHGWNNMP